MSLKTGMIELNKSSFLVSLCSPACLFSLGFLQAMFPYLYWALEGKNPFYSYDISGQPAIIWFCGWISFLFGTRIISPRSRRLMIAAYDKVEEIRSRRVLIFMLIICSAGVVSVISGVYGGIPMLAYFSGISDVNDVNDIQGTALSGQLGFVLACNFAMTMVLVVYWKSIGSLKVSQRILILGSILLIVFQSIMAGKRQGLLFLSTTLCLSLVLSGHSPGSRVSELFGLSKRSRLVGLLVIFLSISLLVYFFGFLAAVRTGQGQIGGVDAIGVAIEQTISYLQFPLINLEVQTGQSPWGPGSESTAGPLLNLIPYRMQQDYIAAQSAWCLAPRVEPGAGAGFYGEIHWYWGQVGVVIFSAVAGMFCQWLYLRSAVSSLALAVYCHLAWTLIAAHSYNHFLMLVYGALPIGIFLVAIFILGGWNFSKAEGSRHQQGGIRQ